MKTRANYESILHFVALHGCARVVDVARAFRISEEAARSRLRRAMRRGFVAPWRDALTAGYRITVEGRKVTGVDGPVGEGSPASRIRAVALARLFATELRHARLLSPAELREGLAAYSEAEGTPFIPTAFARAHAYLDGETLCLVRIEAARTWSPRLFVEGLARQLERTSAQVPSGLREGLAFTVVSPVERPGLGRAARRVRLETPVEQFTVPLLRLLWGKPVRDEAACR